MRFDTAVSFIREEGEYDYSTGNTDAVVAYRTDVFANVADTTATLQSIMYGQIKNGAYTIIIQNGVPHAISHVLMGGKKYIVDQTRKLRRTSTFFVSGGA